MVFFVGTHMCTDGDGHGDGLRSLERVMQSKMFGLVGLDSLTDRRESVGTEDGDELNDSDIGA